MLLYNDTSVLPSRDRLGVMYNRVTILMITLALILCVGCGLPFKPMDDSGEGLPAHLRADFIWETLFEPVAGDCIPLYLKSFAATQPTPIGSAIEIELLSEGLNEENPQDFFYSDENCVESTSHVRFPANSSEVSVYIRTELAETISVKAVTEGVILAETEIQVVPGFPVNFFITGAKQTTAGSCEPYIVGTSDNFGNTSFLDLASSLEVSVDGEILLYADPFCIVPLAGNRVALGPEISEGVFYFRSVRTGESTLTVFGAGLNRMNAKVTIGPAGPIKIGSTKSNLSKVQAGACIDFSLRVEDLFGNASALNEPIDIDLVVSEGWSVYENVNCLGEPVTKTSIVPVSNSRPLSLRAVRTGQGVLETLNSKQLHNLSKTLSIQSATASELSLTGPNSVTAGLCVGPYVIRSRDEFDNLSEVDEATSVTLEGAGNADGAFYSGSNCSSQVTNVTLAAMTDRAEFYFLTTVAGQSLSFVANGGDALESSPTLEVNSIAANTARVTLSGGDTEKFARGCGSAFIATLEDLFGNDTAAQAATTVDLSHDGSEGQFFSNEADCMGNANAITSTDIAANEAAVSFFFRSDTVDRQSIRITGASGNLVSSNIVVHIKTGGLFDLSFSTDGVNTHDFGGDDRLHSFAVDSVTGQIIGVGESSSIGGSAIAVVRFNSQGMVDANFSSTVDLGAESVARAVVIQPGDGKIVLAGYLEVNNQRDLVMVRLNREGTLDRAFGTNGVVTLDLGGDDEVTGLTINGDREFVAVGTRTLSGNSDLIVAIWDDSGQLISSQIIDLQTEADIAEAVEVDSEDSIYIAATRGKAAQSDFALVKLNSSGQFQFSISTDILGGQDVVHGMGLQSDGKILLAGESQDGNGNSRFAIVRYDSDGGLDAGFGTNGVVNFDLGSNQDVARALAVDSTGKIVVAGTVNNNDIGLARLNANGSLDNSFGMAGRLTHDLGNGGVDQAAGVVLQSNGRILVGGSSQTGNDGSFDFVLARFLK